MSSWTVLAVTTAVQVLVSGGALTPPVFAPEAAVAMGIDPRTIGFYTSIVYLGAMLTSLASGGVVGRWGAMRVSQACLVLVAIGLAMVAVASPWLAVLGALVVGFGYGPNTPASSHILARTTAPERRALVFSLKQTGVPLGGMLAGAIVPSLVLWVGWQGAALIAAVAAVGLAVLVQPSRAFLDSDRQPARPLKGAALLGPLMVVWRHRPLRMLALASFTFTAMQLSLSTFLVTFLVHNVGQSLVMAGFVMAAAQGGGVVGRVIWGALADRYTGARWMLALLAFGMAITAGITGLFDASWPMWMIVGVSVAFGATAIGWNGVYLAEVAHMAPAGEAGAATGGALFFTYAGVVFGPSLFGLIAGLPGGYGLAFGLYAVAAAIGGVLVLGAREATA